MQLINKDDINNLATNFKLGTSHPPESCWRGSSFPNCYAKSEISVKNEKVDYCEYFLGSAENMQYGQKILTTCCTYVSTAASKKLWDPRSTTQKNKVSKISSVASFP